MTDLLQGGFGGNPPGTVSPIGAQALAQNTGLAETAMHNRYKQLGLGVSSGGENPQYAGPGTAEQMDTGALPSLVGGIPGMAQATLGQMETAALNQPSGTGGKSGGSLGSLGSLIGAGSMLA